MRQPITFALFAGLLLVHVGFTHRSVLGQYASGMYGHIPVPGTGTKIDYVGDDFEESDWRFVHNMPKSSQELNKRDNKPLAYSVNWRWSEGPERGQPDYLQAIDTPPNGLPGSARALQITTIRSGAAGVDTDDVQQDDLILNVASRIGSKITASEIPSCVVRVFLPDAALWEDRTGPHFGIRLGVRTTAEKPRGGKLPFAKAMQNLPFGKSMQEVPYWPGIWIHFKSETSRGVDQDSAFLTIRSDAKGRDIRSKVIPADQFGWWTFGLSVSGDGRIHYFAKPGVEDLTLADLLTSQYPYDYIAEHMNSFFFNICNHNDGRTWSTPFAIDDPEVFVLISSRVDQLVGRKLQHQKHRTDMTERRKGRSNNR